MRITTLPFGLRAAIAASGPASAQDVRKLEVGQVRSVRDMPANVRSTILWIGPWGDSRVRHRSISGYGRVSVKGQSLTLDGGHMPFDEEDVRRAHMGRSARREARHAVADAGENRQVWLRLSFC